MTKVVGLLLCTKDTAKIRKWWVAKLWFVIIALLLMLHMNIFIPWYLNADSRYYGISSTNELHLPICKFPDTNYWQNTKFLYIGSTLWMYPLDHWTLFLSGDHMQYVLYIHIFVNAHFFVLTILWIPMSLPGLLVKDKAAHSFYLHEFLHQSYL